MPQIDAKRLRPVKFGRKAKSESYAKEKQFDDEIDDRDSDCDKLEEGSPDYEGDNT